MSPFTRPPDWNTDGASWPHREYSQFIDAGDYRWHVQWMADGPHTKKKPVVLLLHGTGAATHSWAGLMPLLAHSFDVFAIDLPGHGFTSAKKRIPLLLPYVASQVGILLRRQGVNPNMVIGHSAGAAIMVCMAKTESISPSAMISINGALSPFGGAAGVMFPLMAKLLYYNPLAAYAFAKGAYDRNRVKRLIEQTGSDASEEMIRLYAILMRRSRHISGALGMMAHWDLTGMEKMITALNCHCTFIAGGNDKAVPPEEARKVAAQAVHGQHILLPGLGHLAHEEAPSRVSDIIMSVASDVELI